MSPSEYPPQFSEGMTLFNRRAYFNAHEAWEQWWIAQGRPATGLAKGLVQAAVAMHHLAHGNLRGFEKLWTSCQQMWAEPGSCVAASELAGLAAAMRRCCEATVARGGGAAAFADDLAPQIELGGAGRRLPIETIRGAEGAP